MQQCYSFHNFSYHSHGINDGNCSRCRCLQSLRYIKVHLYVQCCRHNIKTRSSAQADTRGNTNEETRGWIFHFCTKLKRTLIKVLVYTKNHSSTCYAVYEIVAHAFPPKSQYSTKGPIPCYIWIIKSISLGLLSQPLVFAG
jgi:hypothetical protein